MRTHVHGGIEVTVPLGEDCAVCLAEIQGEEWGEWSAERLGARLVAIFGAAGAGRIVEALERAHHGGREEGRA